MSCGPATYSDRPISRNHQPMGAEQCPNQSDAARAVPARLAVDATCGAGSATTELEPISLTMSGRSPRPSRDAAMGSMIRSSDSPATTPTFTCPESSPYRRSVGRNLE